MIRRYLIPLIASAALLLSCTGDPLPRQERGAVPDRLSLDVFGATDGAPVRSDLVSATQPDAIYDLNVWQYSHNGSLLASFYIDGLSATTGHASVSVRADVWQTDRFVVVANAGRTLDAPASISQRVSYDYVRQTTPSGYMGVLAVGACTSLTQNSESNEWEANVQLQRAMARLDIQLALGSDLTSQGASFQSGGVYVTQFFLMDSPAEFSFVPSDPGSVQSYILPSWGPRANLDKITSFPLPIGGTLSGYQAVYCLPNSQGRLASGWLTVTSEFADATTVGMVVQFSQAFGGSAPGMVGYRFFPAGDNRYVDLVGGRNYRTTVTIGGGGTTGAQHVGRRVDTRFRSLADNTCEIGETIDVWFSTPLEFPEGTDEETMLSVLSLAAGSTVHNDGKFEVEGLTTTPDYFTDAVSGESVPLECVDCVRLRALAPGESTLRYRTTFCGKVLESTITLKAVRNTSIDVGGDDDGGGGNNEYD